MKTRNSIICLLCTAALLLSVSGCSALNSYLPESKEDVLLRLTEYVDGRTPTSATVQTDLAMTSKLGGASANISASIKGRVLIASETDSYAEGEFSYRINQLEGRESAQVYNFAEDGKLLTFTHIDRSDYWSRSETPLPIRRPESVSPSTPVPAEGEEPTSTAEPAVTIPAQYEFLLLEEGTQTLDGRELYLLTGSVDGETCASLLQDSLHLDALTAKLLSAGDSGAAAFDLKQLNFAALHADVALYLDKETAAPVQIQLTLTGMNLLIADFLEMLPAQTAALLGSSVTVDPIQIVFSDIGFDPVTIPAVSEEGRILAMQNTLNPDQGDGTYVLQQYKDSIKLTPPKGWTVTKLGTSFAGFRNPDNTRAVSYELYRNFTGEDFIALVESGMIPSMESYDLTVTASAGEDIGDYHTYMLSADAVNVYLAYRTVGSSLLGIYAEDSSGANITSVLTSVLEAVADHQTEY